jgi:hypothetical protein
MVESMYEPSIYLTFLKIYVALKNKIIYLTQKIEIKYYWHLLMFATIHLHDCLKLQNLYLHHYYYNCDLKQGKRFFNNSYAFAFKH